MASSRRLSARPFQTRLLVAAMVALACSICHMHARDARALLKYAVKEGQQPSLDARTVAVSVDLNMAGDIIARRDGSLRIELPLPGHGTADVILRRSDLIGSLTQMHLTTDDGERIVPAGDVIAYTGTLASMPNSVIALVVTPTEITASLEAGAENWTLGRDRRSTFANTYVMAHMQPNATPCMVNDDDIPAGVRKVMQGGGDIVQGTSDTLELEVAIEADFQWFTYFGGNQNAALAQIVRMLTITDEIYRRDFHVKVMSTDIHIWATANDGYDDNKNATDLIDEFVARYEQSTARRDVAVFVTAGRANGGGTAASIGGICEPGKSYCAVGIIGDLPYGGSGAGSFDATLIAHEIGHVCGGVHTHNCMWIGGPLDSCNASENSSCVTDDMRRPRVGTIMSYCHRIAGGSIEFAFHPRHRQIIRAFLERSACVGRGTPVRTHTLAGTVRNARTGTPLAGLALHIQPYEGTDASFRGTLPPAGSADVVTTADGTYRFEGLAAGMYSVVPPESFAGSSVDITARHASVDVIVVEAEEHRDIELVPVRTLWIDCRTQGLKGVMRIYVVGEELPELYQNVTLDSAATMRGDRIMLRLPVGTYSVIPIMRNAEVQPVKASITLDAAEAVDSLVFSTEASTTLGQAMIAVAARKEQDGLHMHAGAVLTVLVAGASERERYTSDVDGVMLTDALKKNELYEVYFWDDTATYARNSEWETVMLGGDTVVTLFVLRQRQLPTFLDNYSFASVAGSYVPLTLGTELMAKTTSIRTSHRVDLPITFTFGSRASSTMWVYGTGGISFGEAQLPPASNVHTSYAEADVIISPLTGQLYSDTASPASVMWAIEGTEPYRTVVVQWKNMAMRYTNSGTGRVDMLHPIDMQVRLEEGTGDIRMVYGDFPEIPDNVSAKFSAGLRGSDLNDNLTLQMATQMQWSSPVVSNTRRYEAAVTVSKRSIPSPGQTFLWAHRATSVREGEHDEPWTLSPNPAVSTITVSGIPEVSGMRLMDMAGRVVASGDDAHTLEVSDVAAGIYTLVIEAPHAEACRRLVSIVR